jgi:hypothetical protein
MHGHHPVVDINSEATSELSHKADTRRHHGRLRILTDAVEEVADERAGLPIGSVIECYCARRFTAFDVEAE